MIYAPYHHPHNGVAEIYDNDPAFDDVWIVVSTPMADAYIEYPDGHIFLPNNWLFAPVSK